MDTRCVDGEGSFEFKVRSKMRDIPKFDTFVKVEPICKGWSGDKKYYVETKDGICLLLRVSDVSAYDAKKQEFDIMKKMSAAGINMSQPIDFGICEGRKSVYQLLSRLHR